MHNCRPWKAPLEVKPETIKVLGIEGEGVLKAVWTGDPNHPQARRTRLAGRALWRGTPLCAAISAAEPVGRSLALGLGWPAPRALVSFALVDPFRPRRRIGQINVRALRTIAEPS